MPAAAADAGTDAMNRGASRCTDCGVMTTVERERGREVGLVVIDGVVVDVEAGRRRPGRSTSTDAGGAGVAWRGLANGGGGVASFPCRLGNPGQPAKAKARPSQAWAGSAAGIWALPVAAIDAPARHSGWLWWWWWCQPSTSTMAVPAQRYLHEHLGAGMPGAASTGANVIRQTPEAATRPHSRTVPSHRSHSHLGQATQGGARAKLRQERRAVPGQRHLERWTWRGCNQVRPLPPGDAHARPQPVRIPIHHKPGRLPQLGRLGKRPWLTVIGCLFLKVPCLAHEQQPMFPGSGPVRISPTDYLSSHSPVRPNKDVATTFSNCHNLNRPQLADGVVGVTHHASSR